MRKGEPERREEEKGCRGKEREEDGKENPKEEEDRKTRGVGGAAKGMGEEEEDGREGLNPRQEYGKENPEFSYRKTWID